MFIQTLHLGRLPTDTEVDPEVQKEVEKREAEKRNPNFSIANDVEDVRSRVASLEGSMARLEESVTSSNNRVEALLGQLLQGGSSKQSAVAVTEPSSSTQPHCPPASVDTEEGTHAQEERVDPSLSSMLAFDVVVDVVRVENEDGAVDAAPVPEATDVYDAMDVSNDVVGDVHEDVLPKSQYMAVEEVEGSAEASGVVPVVPRSSKDSKSGVEQTVAADESINEEVLHLPSSMGSAML